VPNTLRLQDPASIRGVDVCAYTDLATCPLPPPENRLPVAIEAGEKIPVERS
jgi:uncharacterized protein (DUF1684 family)